MGVSPLHGLIVASIRINHIDIKIDKIKKSHIYIIAIPTGSIYKSSLILVNIKSSILISFA